MQSGVNHAYLPSVMAPGQVHVRDLTVKEVITIFEIVLPCRYHSCTVGYCVFE